MVKKNPAYNKRAPILLMKLQYVAAEKLSYHKQPPKIDKAKSPDTPKTARAIIAPTMTNLFLVVANKFILCFPYEFRMEVVT